MKRVLVGMLAVGMVAGAANAAELSLRWAAAPSSQKLSMNASDTAVIEVVVSLQDGNFGAEEFSAVSFQNLPVANLFQVGATDGAPNGLDWGSGNSTNGQLGAVAQQVIMGADNAANNLVGPGTFVIGTYSVHLSDLDGDVEKNIFFNFGANIEVGGSAPNIFFADETGSDYKWDARYNNTTYPGYVAFGDWGSPGWDAFTIVGKGVTEIVPGAGQAANPLIVTKVPEPTTLALLAVGGFALIRRRRAA